MSVIKKYNSQSERWDPIASSDARGIYTNSFLTEEGKASSVEDVLISNKKDIDLLKKNVSWLALHGGGGAGGGSGAVATNAKVNIYDPYNNIAVLQEGEDIIWTSSINEIRYSVTSTSSASTYTVNVYLDSKLIFSESKVKRNEKRLIPKSSLGTLTKESSVLQVNAIDESESEYSASCKLRTSSISLIATTVNTTREEFVNGYASTTITYRSSVVGRYKLYFATSQISSKTLENGDIHFVDSNDNDLDVLGHYREFDINQTTSHSETLNIRDMTNNPEDPISLIPESSTVGIYSGYFLLVNNEYSVLRSAVISTQIVLSMTNGILVSPMIGVNLTSPYTSSLDGIIPIQFVVYSQNSGTYSYTVSCEGVELSSGSGKSFNTPVSSPISLSRFPDVFNETGKTYVLDISATQGYIGDVNTNHIYVRVTSASSEPVLAYKQDLNNYAIYDFTFWEGNFSGNTRNKIEYRDSLYYGGSGSTTNVISSIDFKNMGSDSGDNSGVYLTFRHSAHGILTVKTSTNSNINWFPIRENDTTSLIPYSDQQFTFQIAYKTDPDLSEMSTVFKAGDISVTDDGKINSGQGIWITSHKYYIKYGNAELKGVLQDNTFQQIDITLGKDGDSSRKSLRIYQNGTLLGATYNVSDTTDFGQVKKAFIACSDSVTNSQTGYVDVSNRLNLDIYCLRFYKKCLNVGQIVCSYINNYANFKRELNEEGKPVGGYDPILISTMLENNGIKPDSEVRLINDRYDTSDISSIYDLKEGKYTWGIRTEDGTNVIIPNSLKNLPIPIVSLTVSWTFDEFSRTSGVDQSSLIDASTNSYFSFQKIGSNDVDCSGVEVSIQGTTTAGYSIKNVNVKFPEDTLFSPLNTWFPENEFTLKADIVDSSHTNNAVIGKFVNDCFNTPGLDLMNNSSEAFPTRATLGDRISNGKLPDTLTIKPTIEGFPILLIMNFSDGLTGRDIRILGIYSFNLGRESIYNQGFEIPNGLYKYGDDTQVAPLSKEDAIFPGLFSKQKLPYSGISACCYEGKNAYDCSINSTVDIDNANAQYDYLSCNLGTIHRDNQGRITTVGSTGSDEEFDSYYPSSSVSKSADGYVNINNSPLTNIDGEKVPWDSKCIKKNYVNPDGFFWSSDETFRRVMWSRRYAGSRTSEADIQFKDLCDYIENSCPYYKGNVIRSVNTSYKRYRILESGVTSETNQSVTISRTEGTRPQFSVKNVSFYYVISLLFGLVDNLGKNLQMKKWFGDSVNSYWSPTFYDMDTALGLTNTGYEDIDPAILDGFLINLPDGSVSQMFGQQKSNSSAFDVSGNKLWGVIEHYDPTNMFNTDFSASINNSFYATTWNMLRTNVIQDVDEFIDKYFTSNLENCGELLFNYDYLVKYLNTSETHMLHGNRKSFIRSWLKDRIAFLDSYFGYRLGSNTSTYLLGNSIVPYNRSVNNTITLHHNSGARTIPIKTNCSVIIKTVLGNSNTNYTYVPKNVKTDIVVSLSTSGSFQAKINNSDKIINIENLQKLGLTGLVPNKGDVVIDTATGSHKYISAEYDNLYYQYGSLSSLKELDLSDISLGTGLDFFKLFKTWDTTGYGELPSPFSLNKLNLRKVESTQSISVDLNGLDYEGENVPSTYKNPFVDLTEIDVSESSISNINIPSNVTIFKLDISESSVRELSLEDQPVLSSVSFSKCNNLKKVTLSGCDKIKSLYFDESNYSLSNLNISNCQSLETLTIDAKKKYSESPTIVIENCPNLKTILIKECGLSLSGQGIETITLRGCSSLNSFTVSSSFYESIYWDESTRTGITTLNLNGSKVKTLRKINDTSVNDILDLTGYNDVSKFSFRDNTNVNYVKFDNNLSNPIVLPSSLFSGCTSLKRVYGNLSLGGTNIFAGCTSFSIHGTSFQTWVTNSGSSISIKDGNRIKHPNELGIISTSTNRIEPRNGTNVTNITVAPGITNITECFNKTSCTIFDAYYMLCNVGSATNISGLFFKASRVNWSWTEDADNSPNRDLFINCGNVVTLNNLFRDVGSSFRLFSPSMSVEGDWNTDGLFSPLISAQNLSLMFSGTYYIDKNLFKRPGGNTFNITNLSYFVPAKVIKGISTMSYSTFSSYLGANDPIVNNNQLRNNCGDLSNFLSQCPNVTSILGLFNGVNYIDYSKFNNEDSGFGLGNTFLYEANAIFVSNYASGEINLQNIFSKKSSSGNINVKTINSSFRVLNSTSRFGATRKISNNDLVGFVNLTSIGIRTSGDYATNGDIKTRTFGGPGITTVVSGNSFPYELLSDCKRTITSFIGYFMDANMEEKALSDIELPGTLFDGCSKLEDIRYCFYNFNRDLYNTDNFSNYVLTGEGFKDSTNLKDVRYLFGSDISGAPNSITGSIPYKLFYHGETLKSISITGTDLEVEIDITGFRGNYAYKTETNTESLKVELQYRNYKIVEDNDLKIKITPLTTCVKVTTTVDVETGMESSESVSVTPYNFNTDSRTKTITISYNEVRSTIENITGCFQCASLSPYKESFTESDLPEKLPTYQPFVYIKKGNTWSYGSVDKIKYTLMWKYNGIKDEYISFRDSIISSNPSEYKLEEFEELDPILYSENTEPNIEEMDLVEKSIVFNGEGNNTTAVISDVGSNIEWLYSNYDLGLTGHFCAPPDLLRYCTQNASVSNLFNRCGNTNHTYQYTRKFPRVPGDAALKYGIRGRLCPYLLKPVSKSSDFTNMFRSCKWLNWYKKNNTPYLIPENFFSFVDSGVTTLTLDYMFADLMFPHKVNLDVFNFPGSSKKYLNLVGVFYWPKFKGVNVVDSDVNIVNSSYLPTIIGFATDSETGQINKTLFDSLKNILSRFINSFGKTTTTIKSIGSNNIEYEVKTNECTLVSRIFNKSNIGRIQTCRGAFELNDITRNQSDSDFTITGTTKNQPVVFSDIFPKNLVNHSGDNSDRYVFSGHTTGANSNIYLTQDQKYPIKTLSTDNDRYNYS